MISKEDFVYALGKLAKEGNISALNDFYSPKLDEGDRELVENALVEAIRTATRNGKGFALPILRRDDISDRILLEAMEACRTVNWQVEPIANILRYKNKSDEVILKAVEICAENNRISVLNDSLNRKDLSDRVVVEIAGALVEQGWQEHVSMFLLSRNDISTYVRNSVEKTIERTKRNEDYSPKGIVKEYFESKGKMLGGDGVLSERNGKIGGRENKSEKPERRQKRIIRP